MKTKLSCLALILAVFGPLAAEGEDDSRFYVHASAGYTVGIAPSQDIRKREGRVGGEQVFHPALSGGPEFALVRFTGSRNGQDADSKGGTLLYQLKWHPLRYRGYSLYLGFGFGGAYFLSPFPPGGTRFNGYSFFGAGLVAPVGRHALVLFDVREMHHSNGRGLVADNPAFDGLSFNLGLGFRP